jgi:hypothetical protein
MRHYKTCLTLNCAWDIWTCAGPAGAANQLTVKPYILGEALCYISLLRVGRYCVFNVLSYLCIDTMQLLLIISKINVIKGKGLPQEAEVAQGVPGRLRSRIFLTLGTTRVSLTHRPPLPQEKSLVLIFRGWVDPRAHGSIGSHGKNPQWHHRESIPRPSD